MIRRTASTASSLRTLITWSAPSFLPISRRPSRVPVRITGSAPNALATATPISPIGPGPVAIVLVAVVLAVVEARGVHALPAALAAAAAGVDLDRDPLARLELVDVRPELDHRAHVLVAGREPLVERKPALDHGGGGGRGDVEIGGADGGGLHPHQDLGRARLGHRLVNQAQLIRIAQHPGPHGLWNRVLVRAARLRHAGSPPCRSGASRGIAANVPSPRPGHDTRSRRTLQQPFGHDGRWRSRPYARWRLMPLRPRAGSP